MGCTNNAFDLYIAIVASRKDGMFLSDAISI